ncbi:hypothetical protein XENORESO_009123 [Xenotaenia resolanae]|uniref:Uncharacterized protein n=1 Tax=Xenotaenia resolanae TaxID=208358 RepID=A0ABV0WJF5_9TELE
MLLPGNKAEIEETISYSSEADESKTRLDPTGSISKQQELFSFPKNRRAPPEQVNSDDPQSAALRRGK